MLPPCRRQETRSVLLSNGLMQLLIVRRWHANARERLALEHKAERGRRLRQERRHERLRLQQIRRDGELCSPILIDALDCLD